MKKKKRKGPQYSKKIEVGGGDGLLLPPLAASAHACNRVALIITISCIKSEY